MNENTLLIPIVSPDHIGGCSAAIYVHGLALGAASTTINSLACKLKHYFGNNQTYWRRSKQNIKHCAVLCYKCLTLLNKNN